MVTGTRESLRLPFPSPVPFTSIPTSSFQDRKCCCLPRGAWLTCRLEIPTAEMIPNITRNMPPITGVGMVANAAPIFPNMPIRSNTQPAATITILLPTCSTRGHQDEKLSTSQATRPHRPLRCSPGTSISILDRLPRAAPPNPAASPLCSRMVPLGKDEGVTRWQLNIQVRSSDPQILESKTFLQRFKATDICNCQARLSACGVASTKKGSTLSRMLAPHRGHVLTPKPGNVLPCMAKETSQR